MSDSNTPKANSTNPQRDVLLSLISGLPMERQTDILNLFNRQDAQQAALQDWIDTYGTELSQLQAVRLGDSVELMERETLAYLAHFLKLAEAFRQTDNKPESEQLALLKRPVKELLDSSSHVGISQLINRLATDATGVCLTEAIAKLRQILGYELPEENDEARQQAPHRAQQARRIGALVVGDNVSPQDGDNTGGAHGTACVN